MYALSNAASHDRRGPGVFAAALAFFFILTSYYIIRPVRDQLSGAVGAQALPAFYFYTFIVMLLIAPLFGFLVVRFKRQRLLGWCYSFFIVCLLAFIPAFVAQDRIGARLLGEVFFCWVSVFNLFVVSLFWSFMADIFDSESSRRAFPLIALGGMAGAVFGPLVTSALVQWIGVAPLLVVSAIALAAALFLLLQLSAQKDQFNPTDNEPIGGSLWTGIRDLWSRPFMRYMALLMLFGDGIGTLAYALVANYAKLHLSGNIARTAFYGHIDLAVNTLGGLLQLTVTRWLLIRLGPISALVLSAIVNSLLLLLLVVLGDRAVIWLGVIPLVAMVLLITRGFAYGVTKPAADALYTRVPRETRYKSKNFVDTAVWRFGDLIVTSGVSALFRLGVGVSGMAALGLGVSLCSIWISKRAGTSPDLLPEQPTKAV